LDGLGNTSNVAIEISMLQEKSLQRNLSLTFFQETKSTQKSEETALPTKSLKQI